MSKTLLQYLTDMQRLLHDSTYRFWTQQELYDYINEARKVTASETGCTRQLQSVDVISAASLAQATYSMDNLVAGRRVTDVLDIHLQYTTTTTYPLKFYVFSKITRTAIWQYQMPGTPQWYTIHGRNIYILNWPSQEYAGTLFDCALEPLDLVNAGDLDGDVVYPYTACVKFYAAYLAKLKTQRREEADNFLRDYERRKISALAGQFTRRLPGQ